MKSDPIFVPAKNCASQDPKPQNAIGDTLFVVEIVTGMVQAVKSS